MKLRYVICLLLLATSAFAQTEKEKDAMRKMFVAMTYEQYAQVYLGKEAKSFWERPHSDDDGETRPFETKGGFADVKQEFERLKSNLSELTLDKRISYSGASFNVPTTFFPDIKSEHQLRFIVDEVLDVRGENIVEPLSEKVYDNLGFNKIWVHFDEETEDFTIPLLTEDKENTIYKARGILAIKLAKTILSETFEINQTIKFEDLTIKVVKKEKNYMQLIVEGDSEAYEFDYLDKDGRLGNSVQTSFIDLENPVFKHFIKENRVFTEEELEAYAQTLDLEELIEYNKSNPSPNKIMTVTTSITVAKIVLSQKPIFEEFEIPFEVFAEGAVFLGDPVNFSEISNKDIFRDNENSDEPISDDTDITTIKNLLVGTYDVEYSDKANKSSLLFDNLPTDVLKFKGVETLRIRFSNNVNLKKVFEDLSTLKALSNLDSPGFDDTDEDGNEVVHRIEMLPENISKLTAVSSIYIPNHFLHSLPASFQTMQRISFLDLSNNAFSEFPKEILALKNLEVLDLSGNFISEIPESICDLKQLTTLRINSNRLTKLPECLNSMENLYDVYIPDNFLGDFIEKNPVIFEGDNKFSGITDQSDFEPIEENVNYQFYKKHTK